MILAQRKIVAGMVAGLLMAPWGLCAAAAHHDPLTDMFVWWNSAYKQPDGFTPAAFAKYFTPDAVLRVNGVDRCKGLAQWAAHFRDIQAHTQLVEIELPFIDEFESRSGDRIVTHHLVKAREHGKDSLQRVMGYAAIENGRISLINFVSVPEANDTK
jgi:molybdate-binding protein